MINIGDLVYHRTTGNIDCPDEELGLGEVLAIAHIKSDHTLVVRWSKHSTNVGRYSESELLLAAPANPNFIVDIG